MKSVRAAAFFSPRKIGFNSLEKQNSNQFRVPARFRISQSVPRRKMNLLNGSTRRISAKGEKERGRNVRFEYPRLPKGKRQQSPRQTANN